MLSNPDLSHEKELWQEYAYVAGLDEAGRGALAGPVCVAAVILLAGSTRLTSTLSGVRDSKQTTRLQRERLMPLIIRTALDCGIGHACAAEIDQLGIVSATRLAASRAIESLSVFPDFLLTDFRLELPELDVSQAALVKGDQRSLSIASASILAKTARDDMMEDFDSRYPKYGFAKHKGYGTLYHRKAISRFGLSPIHRKTFQIKRA
jgi:ribonuclease HII